MSFRGINVNVLFRGKTRGILEAMVEEGYANSLSEAVRLTINSFGEKHFDENGKVAKKLDRIDQGINSGKRKKLTAKEAMGDYAKHLK